MKNGEFSTVATQYRTQTNEVLTPYVPYQHYGLPFWEAQNLEHMHHTTAWAELRRPSIEKTKGLLLVLPASFACSSHLYTCAKKGHFQGLTLPEFDSENVQHNQFSSARESLPQESW